eukprot:6774755-Pyramimonas_sp.AAC.1
MSQDASSGPLRHRPKRRANGRHGRPWTRSQSRPRREGRGHSPSVRPRPGQHRRFSSAPPPPTP